MIFIFLLNAHHQYSLIHKFKFLQNKSRRYESLLFTLSPLLASSFFGSFLPTLLIFNSFNQIISNFGQLLVLQLLCKFLMKLSICWLILFLPNLPILYFLYTFNLFVINMQWRLLCCGVLWRFFSCKERGDGL